MKYARTPPPFDLLRTGYAYPAGNIFVLYGNVAAPAPFAGIAAGNYAAATKANLIAVLDPVPRAAPQIPELAGRQQMRIESPAGGDSAARATIGQEQGLIAVLSGGILPEQGAI